MRSILARSIRCCCQAAAKPFCPVLAPRHFTTSGPTSAKAMPPRPKPPPDSEIEESYLKGSGPGGQKINKTNSAVQLKHLPTGIVVKSQATRSRDQNRKEAREILARKIDELQNGDKSRTAIVAGVKNKRKASAQKKSRRKYKKLEEEKEAAERAEAGISEEDHASSVLLQEEGQKLDRLIEEDERKAETLDVAEEVKTTEKTTS